MPVPPAVSPPEPVTRERTPWLLLAVSAAAGVTMLAACGSSAASDTPLVEKPNLAVAVVPATSVAGLYIAAHRGYFAEAGLHVKITPVASGVNALPSLANVTVDIDEGQWTSDVAAEATGAARPQVLAPGNSGGTALDQAVIAPGSPARTVQQLRGKTIAVNALTGLAVLLTSNILNSNGVAPASVHFVGSPFPARGPALAAHRVDAAFITEPFLSASEQPQGVVPLVDIDQGAATTFPIAGYVSTSDWAARYPQTAAAFVRALTRGQQVAATSGPVVEQAMTANLTISKQTAAVMARGSYPLTMTASELQRVATLMQLNGLFSSKVSTVALVKEMVGR